MDIDTILEADGKIYKTWIPGCEISFSYRLLSLREYRVFKGLRDAGLGTPYSIAEKVFERCFIGEAALIPNDIPAGLTISIGQLILYLSGDCDDLTLKEDINKLRKLNPSNTVFEHMRAVICTAFSYKIEDIESWTRPEFLKKFIIAENILSKRNPDFVQLSLDSIKTQEELDMQANTKVSNIDFKKENRLLTSAVGKLEQEEAQIELTKKQLATLSKKSHSMRGR